MGYLKIKNSKAFTLIELLVVILIVALLIAVAAPSFLGQQTKAQDSQTKQNLTVLSKALKAAYISEGKQEGYPALGVDNDPDLKTLIGSLKNSEPNNNIKAYLSTDYTNSNNVANENTVSVSLENNDSAVICQKSKSKVFFCLKTDEKGNLIQLKNNSFSNEILAGQTMIKSSGNNEKVSRCALNSSTQTELSSCTQYGQAILSWDSMVQGESQLAGASSLVPVNSVIPSVSGTVSINSVLTASNGVWSNSPSSYSYQWQACKNSVCNDISGASSQTFQIGIYFGYTFKVKVKAVNSSGTSQEAVSNETNVVSDNAYDYYKTAVLNDSPVSYWRLDDTGTSVTDQKGANNGSYVNSPQTVPSLAPSFGSSGSAKQFNSTLLQRASLGTGGALNSSWTVEAWARIPASGSSSGMILARATAGGAGYQQNYVLSTYGVGGQNNGAWPNVYVSGVSLPNNTVYHIVGQFDSVNKKYKLFINGVLNNSVNLASSVAEWGGTQYLSIGSLSEGTDHKYYLNSSVDEIAIYNGLLSSSSICNHYKIGMNVNSC